jgi:enhancing lycopene biosynthesis protein 2
MRIAVLFGGCGHYDGTDAAEAVLTLLALEGAGETPLIVAPDIEQERTVDHRSGDAADGDRRNVLREAARLARAPVRALAEARPQDLEALIIPGGYGPVVNFTTGFARLDRQHGLRPEIEPFLRHFLDTGKPIGLVSLAEVPVRRLLGLPVAIAPAPADPARPAVDRERRLVHTPGFAAFTRLADVRAGIEAMVAEVLRLMAERALRAGAERPREGAP